MYPLLGFRRMQNKRLLHITLKQMRVQRTGREGRVDMSSRCWEQTMVHIGCSCVSPAICQGQLDQDGSAPSPPSSSVFITLSGIHLYVYHSRSRFIVGRYQSNDAHYITQCHVLSWPRHSAFSVLTVISASQRWKKYSDHVLKGKVLQSKCYLHVSRSTT